MYKIQVEELTRERFSEYGSFYHMENPSGNSLRGDLHNFFPDRITGWADRRIGFSPIVVKKPERMVIDQVEMHMSTWEMILPLNDAMIIHVSPASGNTPRTELTRAFLVPRHTLVKINTAIWHLAPLPENEPELWAMIVLPECTYLRDCHVVNLEEKQKFEIIK